MTDKKPNQNEAKLAELRQAHGDLASFVDPKSNVLFAFRAPSQDEYEDAQERMKKGERAGAINRELCARTLIHPAGDDAVAQLDKVFARAARVPVMVTDELMSLAEGGIEVTVKKG